MRWELRPRAVHLLSFGRLLELPLQERVAHQLEAWPTTRPLRRCLLGLRSGLSRLAWVRRLWRRRLDEAQEDLRAHKVAKEGPRRRR